MGLISKLRLHDPDRRKSASFTAPKASALKPVSPSHTKASDSVSSSTSDFSHTSFSSASSQDSGNRNLEYLHKQQQAKRLSNSQNTPASTYTSHPASNRNSMPVISAQSSVLNPRKRDPPMPAPVYQRSALNQQPSQSQHLTNQIASNLSHQNNQKQHHAPANVQHPAVHHARSMLSIGRHSVDQSPPPQGPALGYAQGPPQGPPQHMPSPDDTHISMSEESGEGSEATSDGESEFAAQAQTHPYYEQWKQYYQALERQRQGHSQPAPHSHQKKTYPNMGAYAPPHSAPTPASERFFSKASAANSRNSLLLNSRRSTIKSNRSASVPPQEHTKHIKSHSRAVSVNVAVSEEKTNEHNDLSFEEQNDTLASLEASKPRLASSTSAVSRLRQLSLGENSNSDQISDYAAFIASDASENEEPTSGARDREPQNESSARRLVSEVSQKSDVLDYYQQSDYTGEPVSNTDTVVASATSSPTELHRNSSSASANSYSSLQSEKHFNVGPSLRRVATPTHRPTSSGSRRKSKGSQSKKYSPPIAGPPPPLAPVAPVQNYPDFEVQRQLSYIKRQSTGSLPMSDMYMQQIQQQLQQLQQLQHLQQMHQLQQMQHGSHTMGPPAGARSSDSFINGKIDEFVQLRSVIAAGNKTFEYRLKWLKMLIAATNNKLFAYVNIKGEAIPQEQVAENKQFFIRSSVNHLQKLIKELGRSERDESQRLFAEACYIQGCLYSHAYLERFGQDFNYELNYEEADRFYNLSLDNNPGYFRAYFGLGELHEMQQDEEHFDAALENYTESAKMGYNRAIYKVALFHLLVPKVRSTRFFSHFKKLADIDLESRDVQLSGADRDELEEIIGLAQFQLGKIYEGIYPGDLSPHDEFVQASLEIAPVSYAKSLSYYNKAAKLSCVQAQVRLGRVYEDGELDRGLNPKKSVQWYMKASSSPLKYRRHPEAMLGLSRWLMKGTDGMSKHIPHPEPELAVDWCERACQEFAYPEAFYQMGLLVEQGVADGDAREWFEQAYAAGHVHAGERLGVVEGVN